MVYFWLRYVNSLSAAFMRNIWMNFSPLAALLHASNIYYTFPLAVVRIFVFRNYLNIFDIHVLHPLVVKFWSITSEVMLQNFTINGWSKFLLMWHSLQISKWNYLNYIRKGVWNTRERRKEERHYNWFSATLKISKNSFYKKMMEFIFPCFKSVNSKYIILKPMFYDKETSDFM